ncbi:BnaA06g00840D [Brassica napus]|uniref:BnaA06g00840D protein n=1 Tax=Brassica napus TaxID=3708 RepID=A0A078GFE3_BRANA|nr:BnaA06g00840D [Brassica napus]
MVMRPISKNCLIYTHSLCLRRNSTLALSNYKPNPPTTTTSTTIFQCNSQISKLARNGNLQEAEAIFKAMPQRSICSTKCL